MYIVYFKEMCVELDSETQGCDLSRITRTPKIHNHEILCAQYLSLIDDFSRPEAKDGHLWHLVASRT